MRRPRGITVVAVLLGALGAFSVLFGTLGVVAFAVGNGRPEVDQAILRTAVVFGVAYLALGVAQLVVAWAMWTLKRWAWWLTIVLQGYSVFQALAAMAFTEVTSVDVAVFTSLAFSLVIIGYFLTRGVRAAFGR